MLDFRLRVFHTVATLLNFTKAAAALEVTQPAVTKHIKELELSYKVILFDRQPNALALTEAGKVLYKHASIIMAQYDMLKFDINALTQNLSGDLRIGTDTPAAQYILPSLLAQFSERFPNVSLQVADKSEGNINQLLVDKDVDIALTMKNEAINSLEIIPYFRDKIVLCGRKIADNKRHIAVDELTKLPLVWCEEDAEMSDLIRGSLAANAGLNVGKMNVKLRLGTMEGVKKYLLHSDCFTFLPRYAVKGELADNTLQTIKIDKVNMEMQYNIVLEQGQHSPLIDTFLQLARIAGNNF